MSSNPLTFNLRKDFPELPALSSHITQLWLNKVYEPLRKLERKTGNSKRAPLPSGLVLFHSSWNAKKFPSVVVFGSNEQGGDTFRIIRKLPHNSIRYNFFAGDKHLDDIQACTEETVAKFYEWLGEKSRPKFFHSNDRAVDAFKQSVDDSFFFLENRELP